MSIKVTEMEIRWSSTYCELSFSEMLKTLLTSVELHSETCSTCLNGLCSLAYIVILINRAAHVYFPHLQVIGGNTKNTFPDPHHPFWAPSHIVGKTLLILLASSLMRSCSSGIELTPSFTRSHSLQSQNITSQYSCTVITAWETWGATHLCV